MERERATKMLFNFSFNNNFFYSLQHSRTYILDNIISNILDTSNWHESCYTPFTKPRLNNGNNIFGYLVCRIL